MWTRLFLILNDLGQKINALQWILLLLSVSGLISRNALFHNNNFVGFAFQDVPIRPTVTLRFLHFMLPPGLLRSTITALSTAIGPMDVSQSRGACC